MEGLSNPATLLVSIAGLDIGSFRAFYERQGSWLARRCNDCGLVADAVQDTFVAIWQKSQGDA